MRAHPLSPSSRSEPPCCPPKPALRRRALLAPAEASSLAATFKLLANDTRLRLLHALARAGECSVTELSETVQMKPQAVSNQLQRLADRGIVANRREGTSIIYRMVDPCVLELLDRGICLTEDASGRATKSAKRR